ncbi:MAG: glycosyltransferase family 2 protein, partial [Bdellovibrionales bacterium]
VVLSFYNEEDVLNELISRLRAVFQDQLRFSPQEYELIFVNDRSKDRSLEILHEEAQKFPDIRIINMSRNFGVSPCVMAGMEYASGEFVVYMDADLQDPPELIPEMVRLFESERADVVHTRRLSREGETRFKMGLTKLGYLILNRFSSIEIDRNVGDFKLLSRQAVKHLIQLREHRPFVRGMVKWVGFRQVFLNYNREARFAGDTKFPVLSWRVISNFLDSALISFSDAPLKFALVSGFFVSVSSFFYLAVIVVMKVLGWSLPGWSAIMATMLVLGGIQLFTIGVLGLYINAIFVESKRRPRFIIENTFGFSRDKLAPTWNEMSPHSKLDDDDDDRYREYSV